LTPSAAIGFCISVFRELELDAEVSLLGHNYFLGSDPGVFVPGLQYISSGREVGDIKRAIFICNGEKE
jgi:hypothetical protein